MECEGAIAEVPLRVVNSVKMNKNGVPMRWQVTPYFVHFAQLPDSEQDFRNCLELTDAAMWPRDVSIGDMVIKSFNIRRRN